MSARFIIHSDTVTQYWHGLLQGSVLVIRELKARPSIMVLFPRLNYETFFFLLLFYNLFMFLVLMLLWAFFMFSLAAVDTEC